VTAATASGLARIASAFATADAAGRGALVPYLCAGDPDRVTSAKLLAAAAEAGADLIELGIPYGDPLADGPTIAAAAQRALEAGTTIEDALELAAGVRGVPVVMFTYLNPILQYGLERFAAALVRRGIAGAIVPDVPLEETDAIRAAFAARGLAFPQLIAPTTPPARAEALARASTGFTYLVSRLGVTGAKKEPDFDWIAARAAALRRVSETPLAIGFGISTASHVRRACAIADGAIVGSALIDAYAGAAGDDAAARVRAFVAALAGGTPRGKLAAP
jgi:tryptophan synthase alpha chain